METEITLREGVLFCGDKPAPQIFQFIQPTDKCCLDCMESFGCIYETGEHGGQKTYCRIKTEDGAPKSFYTLDDNNADKCFFCSEGRSLNGVLRNTNVKNREGCERT
jgi:hypothetical protein